ncbi:MAG: bifunctional glutamate N-acetyltransferase/amino-acid acetyltransferase ArgJ [Ktedonobacterales bacterium]
MSDPTVIDDNDYKTRDLPEGMRLIEGGVTASPGFRAGAISCGIKSADGTPDLALLVADTPCVMAAMFTTSRTPAHTVITCKEHLSASGYRAQAVVVNSGNANCSNGERGYHDAQRMTQLAAQKLGIEDPNAVLVSSTGIIGRPLPMEKVEQGIAQITVDESGGPDFARGIMTTDTRPKTIAVEFALGPGGQTVHLGGSTKGVGMIYPNMATMLCYLTTDVAVEQPFLQQALRSAVNDSFNMVCVDGDMSTNDSVFIFANGHAGNEPLRTGAEQSPEAQAFVTALRYVTRYLAREQARDGEGATRLMIVNVRGAASDADARKAARAVTASPLWQCAVAGGDPNWGRVIAAVGASGADIVHDALDLALGDVQIVRGGVATDYDQAAAKRAVSGKDVYVNVDLHQGAFTATAWGCDLTHGYIDENTSYTR